jgi:hypothetical protein
MGGRMDGWAEGWVEEWMDRWSFRKDGYKWGVKVQLSYEVKNKRGKLRCPLLRRKKNFFLCIYDVITWGKQKKSSANYYLPYHL